MPNVHTLEFKNATDFEIIDLVLGGEKNLFEILVRRYNGYLYKVGRSYGFKHADVEDLMQETYVNAFSHLGGFKRKAAFKTWLVQIMLHQCYHKGRKSSFKNEKTIMEELGEGIKSFMFGRKRTDGDKTVQNLELKEIIENAILTIPDDYRMVFTLRELTGLSTAETAEMLDISESNVKVRLNRAKKMLQKEIEKTYTPTELFEFNLIHCDPLTEKVMKKTDELTIKSIS